MRKFIGLQADNNIPYEFATNIWWAEPCADEIRATPALISHTPRCPRDLIESLRVVLKC